MTTNAELSQMRPPSRREPIYEPLWRYQDLAPALPPRPLDDVPEPPRGRGGRTTVAHLARTRRPRRSAARR